MRDYAILAALPALGNTDARAPHSRRRSRMKALIVASLGLASSLALALSPAMEKQFIDTYKKAYEAKDTKTLNGLLYTKGADPQALEFYKMMMTADMGGKITSIKLVDLDAEDKKKASETMKGPGGGDMKLTLPAVKKLVIETKSSEGGSSSGTSSSFVGEADGKLWIDTPGPAKK